MFKKVRAPAQFSAAIIEHGNLLSAFLAGVFSQAHADTIVLQIFCKGKSYSFNLSGAMVWLLIEHVESTEALVAKMCSFYPSVSVNEMEGHVRSIIGMMINDGLLFPTDP